MWSFQKADRPKSLDLRLPFQYPGLHQKRRPLTPDLFVDFERCYGKNPNGSAAREVQGPDGRFRAFHVA
jgi:hypothetical protein